MTGKDGGREREREVRYGGKGKLREGAFSQSLFLDGNGDNTRFFFFEGSVGPNV